VVAGEGLDATGRGEVRLLLGRLLLQLGEFDEAVPQIEAGVEEVAEDAVLVARGSLMLAFPRGRSWPVARHHDWLDKATGAMAGVDDTEARASLEVDRALAMLMLGDEQGWALADELPGTKSPFERRQAARLRMNLGHMAMVWGRDTEARRHLEAAASAMATTAYGRLRNSVSLTLAHLDWHAGRWAGLADRSATLLGDRDTLPEAALEARLVLARLALAGGDWPGAEAHASAVLADATRRGLLDAVMEPAALLGRLHLAAGDVERALAATEPAVQLVVGKGSWVWAASVVPVHVDALVRAGRQDAAAGTTSGYAAWLAGRPCPSSTAALEVARGTVDGAAGDVVAAGEAYARAAREWAQIGRPYEEMLARERLADTLDARGCAEAATVERRAAHAGLRRLGATWDAARLARSLRRQGVGGAGVTHVWRYGRRGYGDDLSPRELEVARLVGRGMTNRTIAETLFLSPRTVDRHLSSAMRKLGVGSRTTLALALAKAQKADGTSAAKNG
jgi:DNA-binding CsgD family transcriptional regulator